MIRRAALLFGMFAVAATSAGQTAVARVTASRDVASPMPFAIPSLNVDGVVRATEGRRLHVVEIALGDEPVDGDTARFELVAANGARYEPIGAGGGASLIVPLTAIPVGREVGQVLPTDAIVSLVRLSATSVALEVSPGGTLAFLYQVPVEELVRAIRLPDGRELATVP